MALGKQKFFFLLAMTLFFCAASDGAFLFTNTIKDSLWKNSVRHIEEMTLQGAKILSVLCHKDVTLLFGFAHELEKASSHDADFFYRELQTFFPDEDIIIALITDNGTVYLDTGMSYTLTETSRNLINSLPDHGVLQPRIETTTGKTSIPFFKAVTFADGHRGYLFKNAKPQSLFDYYALPFHVKTGYIQVINREGIVIIPPATPVAPELPQDLPSLLADPDNTLEKVDYFQKNLKNDQQGSDLLSYKGKEFFVCHYPIEGASGWQILSVVPNQEILKEGKDIASNVLALCFVIFLGVVSLFLVHLRLNRAYRSEIKTLATTDALTGIRNLTQFIEDGDRLLQNHPQEHFAALYLDIRNFKLLNDVFGYTTGDMILQRLAEILTETAQNSVLSARIAADNFVVLLGYSQRSEIVDYCHRVHEGVEAFNHTIWNSYRIELCTGICCTEDSDEVPTINTLLDRANIAQKEIKNSSKETLIFYKSSMREKILREKDLELLMEEALSRNEFLPYIQPKYAVASGRLAGGEMLVRWQSRERGFLSPGLFIPLFEKNRFIIRLDQYMFQCLCQKMRHWIDEGLSPCPISINVSRVQLGTPKFVETYTRIKRQYAIPDGLLDLEFTESILLDNMSLLVETSKQLKEAGFLCSIDDFGSGYSSLNVLKDVPFDTLKIDGLFFRKGSYPERERIVIQNVVRMARDLHMKTVAEGVESIEQLNFLRQIGCDLVQGYVCSRPIPDKEYSELLRAENGPNPPTRP